MRDVTTTALNEKYGFTAFKLSPFRGHPHRRWGAVVRYGGVLRAVRESHPREWEFAFDAHAYLCEPYQAVELGNALAPYEPLFLEEPIRPEYLPAWHRLRSELKVPLATGESLYSSNEFLSLLSGGGADIVQPDICVVGGISQMRKIATIAEAHFTTVAPHNPMGPLAVAHNLHFAAACSNFSILEHKLDEVTWCPTRTYRSTATWNCGRTGRAGASRSTRPPWRRTTTSTGNASCPGPDGSLAFC